MIESAVINEQLQGHGQTAGHRVLTMVKNERMGGFVPKWEAQSFSENVIEANLNAAQNYAAPETGDQALGYAAYARAQNIGHSQSPFGFTDLLDMVNPLQHIPIVAQAYRGLTGDEIKPASKIIGGALFGGALGAAGGIIDAIIVNETGDDMTGNAMTMAFGRQKHETTQIAQNQANTPELQIEQALESLEKPYDNARALTLVSFGNLAEPQNLARHTGGIYALA